MTHRRLILFAHFDSQDRVRPYIVRHLEALRALGGDLRFISNSPLPPAEVAKAAGLADQVLLRENTGLDFGMWKACLATLDLSAYDELVLTNSSILGPITPLAPIFDRMASEPCDFWGLTESQEVTHHLQSYFLVFRKPVLASSAFGQFWDAVLPYTSRFNVVHAYELGLCAWLWQHGFTSVPAFTLAPGARKGLLDRLFSRRLHRYRNPTLHHPDLLIRAGMPYFKLAYITQHTEAFRRLRPFLSAAGFDFSLL